MSLKTYQKKRRFDKTPEPKGTLAFCVQKHDASHLHYDFRLEHNGVLLSWAVPKGPSMDPRDKRLAIHVEDHPLSYLKFHGIIPKGNYGAGTVELWDIGTYTGKSITEGLKKGHLEFVLHGKKLQGRFDLVKLKGAANENSWLLIKAKNDDPEELAPTKANLKKKGQASKMPKWISPMLAKLVDAPFSNDEWLYEVKFDGYRAISFIDHDQVDLYSRNQNSFNAAYPAVQAALKKLGIQAIFDGEIVSLDKKGRSKFELLKNYQRESKGTLCYYIFDLLFYEGRDLRELPLIERKELLKKILPKSSILRYSDHIEKEGEKFYKEAIREKLEGIMAKKMDSPYISLRSSDWLKIKVSERQEVVIGGFTEPKGSRKDFGSLLLGVYEKGQLRYIGHVGTGFTQKELKEIHKQLEPLIQTKSPFKTTPKANGKPTWVQPKLLCEVSFTEWTKDGSLRHPVFHGLRIDKKAKEVKQEVPLKVSKIKPKTKNNASISSEPMITHPEKIYWKKEDITKWDMIDYYMKIAPFLLPYLKDRPVMLHRYPEGIDGEQFYQKDIKNHPEFIETVPLEHHEKTDNYLLIQDERSLLWTANLGSIELHPMIMHVPTINNPDYLVVDLDPEDMPFKTVISTAQTIHNFLDSLKIPNYCKTSGGRGLHIYIPLKAKYTFEQTELFAKLLAQVVQSQLPDIISLERRPAKRQKKIYFDYLQNLHGGRTMVAPYSLRARPGAPVSTPLKWEEVNSKLDPLKFNIKTMPARLKKVGDLFKPTLGKGIDLKVILKRLEKFL